MRFCHRTKFPILLKRSFQFCLDLFLDIYRHLLQVSSFRESAGLEEMLGCPVTTMFHLGLIFGLMKLLIFFLCDINNDLSFKSSISQLVSIAMVSEHDDLYFVEIHFDVHAR